MLPSAFQGEGVQVGNTTSTTLSEEQPRESRPARTVTFKDSYEELIQSSSRTEPQVSEPASLVGFQMDPQLRERQREQQKAESKAASTVVDLREKINAGKRAREAAEQAGQSSSTTTPQPPAASPTQPEARRPSSSHMQKNGSWTSLHATHCVSSGKCQPQRHQKTHYDRSSRSLLEQGTSPLGRK